MKLRPSLLNMKEFLIKPRVLPRVFYGSRRKTRWVFGSEAFPTMERNLGVSIRGSARIK